MQEPVLVMEDSFFKKINVEQEQSLAKMALIWQILCLFEAASFPHMFNADSSATLLLSGMSARCLSRQSAINLLF